MHGPKNVKLSFCDVLKLKFLAFLQEGITVIIVFSSTLQLLPYEGTCRRFSVDTIVIMDRQFMALPNKIVRHYRKYYSHHHHH